METKPTPIRLPSDLLSEVEAATQFTGLSQQEVMRLAMRIGLVDLRAAKDIAAVIQEAATDKGASFLAYAKAKIESSFTSQEGEGLEQSRQPWKQPQTVPSAGLTKPSQAPASHPGTATIVPLPPQHVAGLNEKTESPAITEKRVAVTYRKRKSS